MKTQLSNLFITALALVASACQTVEPMLSVEFDHNVTLVQPDGNQKEIVAGQSVSIPTEASIFSSNNRKSLILIPISAPDGHFSIKLPKETLGQFERDERTSAERARDANEIARAIIAVQLLISDKRADEALVKIQLLKNKFKNFSYLGFLEASCFILKNDLTRARKIVEITLLEFPDDVLGRQFIESLNRTKEK